MPFKKTIKIRDEKGNSIEFDLYADNEVLFSSISEKNYTLKAFTEEELLNMPKEPYKEPGLNVDNEEDDNFASPLSIYTTNYKNNFTKDIVSYSITEDWQAPEEIEDRDLAWHDVKTTTFDYAKVKNNRCCWAIYATWEYRTGAGLEWTTITEGYKLYGTSSQYASHYCDGVKGSYQILLKVKYRKDKHFSAQYGNSCSF